MSPISCLPRTVRGEQISKLKLGWRRSLSTRRHAPIQPPPDSVVAAIVLHRLQVGSFSTNGIWQGGRATHAFCFLCVTTGRDALPALLVVASRFLNDGRKESFDARCVRGGLSFVELY